MVGGASLAAISRARTNWHRGKNAPGDTSPEHIQSVKFLGLTTHHRRMKHCDAISVWDWIDGLRMRLGIEHLTLLIRTSGCLVKICYVL